MHIRSLLSLTCLLSGLVLAAMPAQAQQRLQYAGVNLAGAEFNSSKKPGTLYKDYTYPGTSDYAYFAGKGMNLIRLPFLWERLQPQAYGPLDQTQLDLIRQAVQRAADQQQTVLLDVHNYAKYNGGRVGSSLPPEVLADLWRRLAPVFGGDARVMFGLMNEPNAVTALAWAQVAQASIDAIRATGADNLILVPGTAYSGAHSWRNASATGGTSNADALVDLHDPQNRLVYEVHQYLDRDSSGTQPECVSETVGVDRLRGFTDWARSHGKRGLLGEFGAADNPTCLAALEGMLQYMQDNGDVWTGWAYWAAGAWWNASYPFLVQPTKDGQDRAQMPLLSRFARQASGR